MSNESGKDYRLYLPNQLPQGWTVSHSMSPATAESGIPTKRFYIDISGSGRLVDNPAEGVSISELPTAENNKPYPFNLSLDSIFPADIRARGSFRIQLSWVEDPDSPMRGSAQDLIEEVLLPLSTVEQHVLRKRFGLENGIKETQKNIGQEIGRSPRTVGRIEKRALTKLCEEEGISKEQLRELFIDASDVAAYTAHNTLNAQ